MKKDQEDVRKRTLIDLISGLLSGFVAVSLCHPLDVARTRLNVQMSINVKKKYSGILDVFKTIYKEEGWKGFYKGTLYLSNV